VVLSGEIPRQDGRLGFPGGLLAQVDLNGRGRGGNLTVETRHLSISDGSKVQVATFGQGDAGDLLIRASEVDVFETSRYNYFSTGIFAGVEQDPRTVTPARGNGGNLTIETGRLSIYGGQVSSDTWGDGNAGRLLVQARDLVEVVDTSPETGWGSFLSANVNEGARGAGGILSLETRQLSVRGSLAEVSASTFGEGKAGDLTISASDSVELSGGRGGLFAQVNPGATGTGGNLRVETRRLSVKDGARVSVNTFGTGDAGSLFVQARDSVEVIGSSATGTPSLIRASVTQEGTGRGGNLTIETGQLMVRDGAQVNVSSQGSGDAGELWVTADSIQLDNKGKLTAQTASGDGGNITLNVQDLLLLRHNSEISTSAGTEHKGGDGGNITINSPFIVAVPKEDSDITANAYTGRGGNINITTQGIYGLQFRPNRTPLSDITASSDFGVNGTVQINSTFDVTQSVNNLPIELVDASNQIDQTCSPSGAAVREGNRFVITGRGGLPPSPNEPLQGESVVTHWVTIDSQAEHPTEEATSAKPASSAPNTGVMPAKPTLIEAQGWRYGANGEVILTASASTATPQSPPTRPAVCGLK
jgi:large exoprotein involved in heme utilization and adhesion